MTYHARRSPSSGCSSGARTFSNELCGAGVQPARRPRTARARAPPTARVAPTATPTATPTHAPAAAPSAAPPAAPPADELELVEFRRSPVLRRRVHPKPHAGAAPAFTGPAPAAPAARMPPRRASPRAAPLSDLDVQLAHAPPAPPERPPRPAPAPARARGGRLISATVDTWARSTVHVRDGVFKPLVFGGTYPIDEPASPPGGAAAPSAPRAPAAIVRPIVSDEAHRRELRKTIERSLDRFEAILARREGGAGARPRTFDIDEPMCAGAPPAEAMARERDAKYYVAGPKTYNIDEPVSFI